MKILDFHCNKSSQNKILWQSFKKAKMLQIQHFFNFFSTFKINCCLYLKFRPFLDFIEENTKIIFCILPKIWSYNFMRSLSAAHVNKSKKSDNHRRLWKLQVKEQILYEIFDYQTCFVVRTHSQSFQPKKHWISAFNLKF